MRFTNATLRITFSVPCRGTASNLTLDLMQKGRRTFSGMLARLRQKALKFPYVEPEPSPRLFSALEALLASQKRGVPYVAPSSEWDAKVSDNRAKAAAFSMARSGDVFFTPACSWRMKDQAFA